MLVEHPEGELQEANELIHNLQIEVLVNADMNDDESTVEGLEEVHGEFGVESRPGTP